MGFWERDHGAQVFMGVGEDLAASGGVVVAASETVHTKGPWVELEASTPREAAAFVLYATLGLTSADDLLIDIAIGSEGNEIVVVSNFLIIWATVENGSGHLFPIRVPAGSRISARVQATNTGRNVRLSMVLLGASLGGTHSLERCTTYGADPVDTSGVEIDPGGIANTKGGWSEIVSATPNPVRYLIVAIGGQNNTNRTPMQWLLDIGVGPEGSELVLIPNMALICNGSNDLLVPASYGFPVSIPTGTRIAARAQCSSTDSVDRKFDIALYGVD